jgi:HEAT repeat protein
MANQENKPFSAVLTDVLTGEQVHVPLLYRLSDLSAGQMEELQARWPQAEEERRRVVMRHLADLSEENFQVDFAPIFSFGLQDSSPAVRMAALDGLWDTDKTIHIGPITAMMQTDENTEVRALAAATLGHYILLTEWHQIPRAATNRVVEALLAQYDAADTPHSVRRAVLESLGAATHPRVSSLIEDAYDSGDLGQQLSAVFAMGRSADQRWLSTVIDEMSSPLVEMRVEAARAAGGIGDSDALERLEELTEDEDLEVRLAAVYALGQIGGDTAYRVLERIGNDPDAGELHEAVDEALEEMDWLGGELDLSAMEWADEDDL